MPAVTERQRRFFGAELARARAGKRTKTKLPAHKLREFARSVRGSGSFSRAEIMRGYRKVG